MFYTVHGFLHMWPPQGPKERLVQKVEQVQARRTRTMLFQSEEDLVMARQQRYGSKLVFLGNGVEDSWFDLSSRSRGSELQLLYVGRLVREKGILELLDALARVEDVHLHVAGAALSTDRDPVADQVSDRVSTEPLRGRVTLHGMLPREALQDLFQRVDAFCLPSYREGVPRSVIEALAAGRPVLTTDIRGSRELVTDGQNGFLVPPRDSTALAARLALLKDLDSDTFALMSKNARVSVDPDRRESSVYKRIIAAYRADGFAPH